MRLTKEDYAGMFGAAAEWFAKSHIANKQAMFPVICYDTMYKGGASQLHPHFQVRDLHWLVPQ